MVFHAFIRLIDDYLYWALCPLTGEPILMGLECKLVGTGTDGSDWYSCEVNAEGSDWVINRDPFPDG